MVAPVSHQRRYRSAETICLGKAIRLSQAGLFIRGERVELKTLHPLRLDELGSAVIQRIGATESSLVVPASVVENLVAMMEVANQLVKDVSYLEHRPVTGWPAGGGRR